MTEISQRSLDLIEVALDSAASACTGEYTSLGREYLKASREVKKFADAQPVTFTLKEWEQVMDAISNRETMLDQDEIPDGMATMHDLNALLRARSKMFAMKPKR